MSRKAKNANPPPTFSKLMNFGPHFLTLLESPRAGLQLARNLWAKVQKRRKYGDGGRKTENPHLLETDKLSSTYFNAFRKPSGRGARSQKFVGQSLKRPRYCDPKNRKPNFLQQLTFFAQKYV